MSDEERKTVRAAFQYLGATVGIYCLIWPFNPELIYESLGMFHDIVWSLAPVGILVIALMWLFNILLEDEKTLKILRRQRGVRGWLFIIFAGIMSVGPPYLWYQFLADLKKKGLRNGYISAFLYGRSIKPPMIPLMIFYFGAKYTLALNVVMMAAALTNGFIVEILLGERGK